MREPPAIDSVRLIPELRAVHIERYYETTPAYMLYFTEKYDLVGVDVPPEFIKVDLRSALRFLRRSDAAVLEMPEPLWVRFLPTGIAIALTWKLSGIVRRRKRMLTTYAMENNTLTRLMGGRRNVPKALGAVFGFGLGLYIRLVLDKIAFASEGSRDLYFSLPFVASVENQLFEELPSESPNTAEDPATSSAVFVGVLEPRKGVLELMRAWELVETESPRARLTIVGPGPLSDTVSSWAERRPASREYLGRMHRDSVLTLISKATVLVAPSMPDGRWREQVGLPIKEGLSQGLTIVTTDQTGLATWLKRNGHTVIAAADVASDLHTGITEALANPLSRQTVLDSLPQIQGRYRADSWLHIHR